MTPAATPIARGPVVGREQYLEELQGWIAAPGGQLLIDVYGIPGIGKTTLLGKIADALPGQTFQLDFRLVNLRFRSTIIRRWSRQILTGERAERFAHLLAAHEQQDRETLAAASAAFAALPPGARLEAKTRVGAGSVVHGDISAKVLVEIKPDPAFLSDRREERQRQETEEFVHLLAEECRQRPIVLLFDHFERTDSEVHLRDWLLDTFCAAEGELATVPLAVVIFGRKKVHARPAHGAFRYRELGNLSVEDCRTYLRVRGLADEVIQDSFFRLTRGHPYCLFLATEAFGERIPEEAFSGKGVAAEGEALLVAEYLTGQIIANESDPESRRTLLEGSVFRFLNASSLRHLFGWDLDRALGVLQRLEERALLRRQGDYWIYHDLLAELLAAHFARSVSGRDFTDLHRRALAYYQHLGKGGELGDAEWLLSLVEPLYHLLKISVGEAWDYFESIYKPRLDRRDRSLCGLLASQVEIDRIRDKKVAAWFLLRQTDFNREFGHYAQALAGYQFLREQFLPEHGIEDPRLTVTILTNIGWTYLNFDPPRHDREALEHLGMALGLCRHWNIETIEARVLNNMGIVLGRHPGGRVEARQLYEQSLAITEREDFATDPDMLLVAGMTHQNLGSSLAEGRRFGEALAEYEIAFRRYQDAGAHFQVQQTIFLYGCLLVDQKRYELALRAFSMVWRAWQQQGEYRRMTDTLHLAGICHEALGELDLMTRAHAAACKASLLESWDFHRIYVGDGIVLFLTYLCVKRGRHRLATCIEEIVEGWGGDPMFQEVHQFGEFLRQQGDQIGASGFFALPGRKILHRVGCPVGTRLRGFRRLSLSEDGELPGPEWRHCRRCFGSVEPRS